MNEAKAYQRWRNKQVRQNRKIRRQIAKEIDKLCNVLDKEIGHGVIPQSSFRRINTMIGEFGDYLLDTDIRYYEED